MTLMFDLYRQLCEKYIGIRIPRPMYHFTDKGRHFCTLGFWHFEIQCFLKTK